ncbi:GerAB/ArcD/ProY family transporter [Tepidibacter hydrothermalis]|uniref:Endospore germination permease n=1 Tax=Tepidibacter hydrothermalis TaxID=3036126 RepID=A0ABY8EHH3_9FIRM|nr:endospore germination permease [Tepidibacter hydrothermalis]WFD11305.1 endospore germination permease [Tepidibacter hydrothermalis]
MNKELISDKQGICLITLFITGSTFVLGVGAEAEKDSWLAILLSILFAFPILMIYARLLSLFPKKDLFNILEIVFGKFIGKFISILYIWIAFHLGSLVLRNFGEFIVNVSLSQTPMIVPMIFIISLCVWGIKDGIELLGRWSYFFILVIILLVITGGLLLIPNIDINNIFPILDNGIKPVIQGAFGVFSFPFAETILFCLVFSSLKNSQSPYRVYIFGLIIGGIIVFITSLADILILGEHSYSTLFFPGQHAVSRATIGDFIQRIEIIVSISFLTGGFVKISICLLSSCNGVAKLFGFNNYKFIVTPMALLMLNLSHLIYNSLFEMVDWAFKVWPYYSFLFQVILPITIWIVAEIKHKNLKQLN